MERSSFETDTVLVTGSARGIGRACTVQFAAGGATVVGGDIRDQSETGRLCSETAGSFHPLTVDVTERGDIETLVGRALEFGDIDVVVNVAGVVERGPIESHTDADWSNSLDINLTGPFRILREAAPSLRASGGRVVNVSSIYGQIGAAERVGYAASKSGLEGLTRSLAAEFGGDGVRVNAVAPGFIETAMTEQFMDDEPALDRFRGMTALDRLGNPEDVADVVTFLASDRSAYVTGETILVDGGRATVE